MTCGFVEVVEHLKMSNWVLCSRVAERVQDIDIVVDYVLALCTFMGLFEGLQSPSAHSCLVLSYPRNLEMMSCFNVENVFHNIFSLAGS